MVIFHNYVGVLEGNNLRLEISQPFDDFANAPWTGVPYIPQSVFGKSFEEHAETWKMKSLGKLGWLHKHQTKKDG